VKKGNRVLHVKRQKNIPMGPDRYIFECLSDCIVDK
jgi:hypothetical protein